MDELDLAQRKYDAIPVEMEEVDEEAEEAESAELAERLRLRLESLAEDRAADRDHINWRY